MTANVSIDGSRLYRAMGMAALVALGTAVGANSPVQAQQSILGTPEQLEAERLVLELARDPAVLAAKARERARIAATSKGASKEASRRIDTALDQWTNALIFGQVSAYRSTPAILWSADDTPRTWLGHTMPGVGFAADNPDNIYRGAPIDGAGRYLIEGQFDPARRPAQFSIEITRGEGAAPSPSNKLSANKADLGNQIAMITDRDLPLDAEGRFQVMLAGPGQGPGRVALPSAPVNVIVRDTFSDWNQRPARLTLKRMDQAAPLPFDKAELRRRVLARFSPYIGFWSNYPDRWFGGIAPNTISGPEPRDGGWGFMAGMRYQLKPGEGLLVTATPQGAAYVGFQATDLWLIASDATRFQTSLNNSQTSANPDGSITYVISATDPGIANWIDTSGLSEGYAALRWQAVPANIAKDSLVREVRLIKLRELQKTGSLPRITPAERKQQLSKRAEAYRNRLR